MAVVHGPGPVTVLIGAFMVVMGVICAGRISGFDGQGVDIHGRMPRLARFNRALVRVLKWIAWSGLAVIAVGLVIWAAS